MKKENEILRFRPFRTYNGKVTVTSYLGWRKLVTHTINGGSVELFANLDIVPYAHMVNHKGEHLYFPTDAAFNEYPIIKHRCYDCDGVPTFSHITEKRLRTSDYRSCFEPLYTNTVVSEFHKMNEWAKVNWVKLIS